MEGRVLVHASPTGWQNGVQSHLITRRSPAEMKLYPGCSAIDVQQCSARPQKVCHYDLDVTVSRATMTRSDCTLGIWEEGLDGLISVTQLLSRYCKGTYPGLAHHCLANLSVLSARSGVSILASHQDFYRVIPEQMVPLITQKSKPDFLWGVRQ